MTDSYLQFASYLRRLLSVVAAMVVATGFGCSTSSCAMAADAAPAARPNLVLMMADDK